MKKIILFLACAMMLLPLAAASFENNEFQRASRRFTVLAQRAFDDGDYEQATQYAMEAERNAVLSEEFIRKMIARSEAEIELQRARTRFTWATDLKAERNFPTEWNVARSAIDDGDAAFNNERFTQAREYALAAIAALGVVREIIPLPAYYRVYRWQLTRDCFWNVAGLPSVYGNPFLWPKLYEANKDLLSQRANPHLIMPGMIMRIPSLKGEYREGIYDPRNHHETFRSVTGEQ